MVSVGKLHPVSLLPFQTLPLTKPACPQRLPSTSSPELLKTAYRLFKVQSVDLPRALLAS